jgi:glycosyltransferase involved in cell wall biosynthesis
MLYLVVPIGNDFGWGVCGKYLARSLSKYSKLKCISDDFEIKAVGNELEYEFLKNRMAPKSEVLALKVQDYPVVEHPVIQAIGNHNLEPWGLDLRGCLRVGYTFFERSVINGSCIEKARDRFDIIVTGSGWCEKVLREHGIESVTTVRQGVDPKLFNPIHGQKDYFRDKFVVFSGGKFEYRKGQDLVIRAYKVLQDRHKDVMLVNSWFNRWGQSIVTMQVSPYIRFSIESRDYVTAINKILYNNGVDIKRTVTLLPKSHTEMAEIYKNSDVGLFPNRCEGGTNLVLMEYMACGKAAVASYTSGHRDIINEKNSVMIENLTPLTLPRHGNWAGVWDEPDLDEVIANLEWAYQNRDECHAIGKQAAEDMSLLTWEHTAMRFLDITNAGLTSVKKRGKHTTL